MTPDEQAVRAELLEAVAELSRLAPHHRLGQLLCIIAVVSGRTEMGGVWDLEDDEALAATRVLVENAQRHAARREEALAELAKLMPA